MITPGNQHDEQSARVSAQGQWASTYAWGFAVAAALAALIVWSLAGKQANHVAAPQHAPSTTAPASP